MMMVKYYYGNMEICKILNPHLIWSTMFNSNIQAGSPSGRSPIYPPHQCCQSCCRSKMKKKVWTRNVLNVLVLKKVEDSQRILIIIKGWMPKKYIGWIGRYLKKKNAFFWAFSKKGVVTLYLIHNDENFDGIEDKNSQRNTHKLWLFSSKIPKCNYRATNGTTA